MALCLSRWRNCAKNKARNFYSQFVRFFSSRKRQQEFNQISSLALSHPNSGRICFLCDSRNEPCSEDSVNGTRTATCSEGNEFCEVVKNGRLGETRFYRDCVNKCDKEFVNWEKDGEEYCKMCCDNDLCTSWTLWVPCGTYFEWYTDCP